MDVQECLRKLKGKWGEAHQVRGIVTMVAKLPIPISVPEEVVKELEWDEIAASVGALLDRAADAVAAELGRPPEEESRLILPS